MVLSAKVSQLFPAVVRIDGLTENLAFTGEDLICADNNGIRMVLGDIN